MWGESSLIFLLKHIHIIQNERDGELYMKFNAMVALLFTKPLFCKHDYAGSRRTEITSTVLMFKYAHDANSKHKDLNSGLLVHSYNCNQYKNILVEVNLGRFLFENSQPLSVLLCGQSTKLLAHLLIADEPMQS